MGICSLISHLMMFKLNLVMAENSALQENFTDQTTEQIRWSWACRILDTNSTFKIGISTNAS